MQSLARTQRQALACRRLHLRLRRDTTYFQQLDTTRALDCHPRHLIHFDSRDRAINMANYLASIFGTEQDKVNCSFYYKIGACRHGDRCSRKHVKPSYSQTILLPNLYQNPQHDVKNKMNAAQMQSHFDAFYEDVWCELCKFGVVEELVVCDNNNDRA